MTRWMMAASLVAATFLLSTGAHGQESRRRGAQGSFTSRKLTIPRNNLALMLGPISASTFGQRFGTMPTEAGIRLSESAFDTPDGRTPSDLAFGTNFGVMFGLWDNIEAGALFIPMEYLPSFDWQRITVAITYAWLGESVDFGVRFNFTTGDWDLNPSIPVLIRLGTSRFDTGLFLLIRNISDDPVVGINIPLRYSWNPTPNIFLGLESGIFKPAFDNDDEPRSIPLGGFLGYTAAIGARVVDFTASFNWDNFLTLNRDQYDAFQLRAYRVMFGVIINQQVM